MQGTPKKKGLAAAGFAFGILGMLAFWVPGLGTLLTILAVVCSKAALSWAKHDSKRYGGKALATIGFTLGIIFLILSLLLLLGVGIVFLFGYFAGQALGV